MKTKHLYLLLLLVGLSIAGCTANKVRYSKHKRFDKQGRLVYENISYKVLRAEYGVLDADTNINNYAYNADNTLDYIVVCDDNCDTGEPSFKGYVSKYFYRYDILKNQAKIVGVFYEKCSDYPTKYKKVYDTKGLLLEEWYWEMPNAHIDSTCNYNKLVAADDVFDTSYFTTLQTVQYKRVFIYNKKGKLTGITEFRYHNSNSGEVYIDSHKIGISRNFNRAHCKMYNSYLYTCEQREKELTTIPYLKLLNKNK